MDKDMDSVCNLIFRLNRNRTVRRLHFPHDSPLLFLLDECITILVGNMLDNKIVDLYLPFTNKY